MTVFAVVVQNADAYNTDITALPTRTNRDRLGSYLTVPPLPSGQWCDADGTLYQCYLVELQDNAMAHSTSYERVRILDALWRPHYREFTGLDIGNLGNLTKAAIDAPQKATLASGIHARVGSSASLRLFRTYTAPLAYSTLRSSYAFTDHTCKPCCLRPDWTYHLITVFCQSPWSARSALRVFIQYMLAMRSDHPGGQCTSSRRGIQSYHVVVIPARHERRRSDRSRALSPRLQAQFRGGA